MDCIISTEVLERVTGKLIETDTLNFAGSIFSELEGDDQYKDFIQQLDAMIVLGSTVNEELILRILEVVRVTIYYELDVSIYCE